MPEQRQCIDVVVVYDGNNKTHYDQYSYERFVFMESEYPEFLAKARAKVVEAFQRAEDLDTFWGRNGRDFCGAYLKFYPHW